MPTESDLLKAALLEIRSLRARLGSGEKPAPEPIAIIGAGCRFPGNAVSLEAYWQLLRDGVDAVGPIPAERWNIGAFYDGDPNRPGKTYVRNGGFLGDIKGFDAEFFGISPREATRLDPQQRLLLEVSWEAIENAAVPPEQISSSLTGVYTGFMSCDYAMRQAHRAEPEDLDPYTLTGNDPSFTAGRLSYFLGLQGPSMACVTACSSSLVAVHLACQALRAGECDLALAGGVNVVLDPATIVMLSKLRALSPDGRCKTFDASADGYGRGEGCGMVLLERLSKATAQGHRILAVIRGSAVNHDGPSAGLTVPNGIAQEKLLRTALQMAHVSPEDVSYVEAHGTGTSLGDPIELQSIARAMGGKRQNPLLVGSVKTNIGHLEAASGIAGLLKVVLALRHREIPAHLHFTNPSPHVDWNALPLKVNTEATAWSSADGKKRLAGISSFGLSGINAHVIVEEAPEAKVEGNRGSQAANILALSAKTPEALEELVQSYRTYLIKQPQLKQPQWQDVCFTANTGRTHFQHRLAMVAESVEEACSGLQKASVPSSNAEPRIAFVLGGEPQPEIGDEFARVYPAFRRLVHECGQRLRSAMVPQLNRFILPFAIAELWRSWGIQPELVAGEGASIYEAVYGTGDFRSETNLGNAARSGANIFLSIGRTQPFNGSGTWLPFPQDDRAWRGVLNILGDLYSHGAHIDWTAFEKGYEQAHRLLALPTYPFRRQPYWALPEDQVADTACEPAPAPEEIERRDGLSQLLSTPPPMRFEMVADAVANQVAAILGLRSQPDYERPLLQLGMDSLMSAELREWIRKEWTVTLQLQEFLSGACIATLCSSVLGLLPDGESVGPLPPVHESDPAPEQFPLSYGQRALWFIQQSAPQSTSYNVAVALRISSNVDVPALQQCFQTIVDRHPALRTAISTGADGEPLQEVHAQGPLAWEELDCCSNSQRELEERLAVISREPFDLETGPLFRALLCKRSGEKHVLLLLAHHIICDALSFWTLLDELQALYQAAVSGAKAGRSVPNRTYAAFVTSQQEALTGPAHDRSWSYWKQQLSGELPVFNLPTDFPRPLAQTFQGSRYIVDIPENLTARLRELANRNNVTLYTALLAIFNILLYRYTGQEDVIVGSATSIRPDDFANVIGYFVNPVPLRADLSGNPDFPTFLNRISRIAADALEHREFPFPLLVERLQPRRDPSRSPIFQVDFALQKAAPAYRRALNSGSLETEPFPVREEEGQFELGLHITEQQNQLTAAFKFNTDLFARETVGRIASSFLVLLHAITSDPSQRISQVPILSATERERVLAMGQGPAVDYPSVCVQQIFEQQVDRTPDAIALEQFGTEEKFSYRELNGRANQLACHLQTLGIGADAICGIHLERSPELVIAILAVLKAGGAYLPLDVGYPAERKSFMMQDAAAPVLLTTSKLGGNLPSGSSAKVLLLDTEWETIARYPATNLPARSELDQLAYVIYTSGSTGHPKGALITHSGLTNYLYWSLDAYRVAEGSGAPLNLAIGFDATITSLFPPLLTGGAVVLLPEDGGIEALRDVLASERQFSLVKITPAHLELLGHMASSGLYARMANRFVIGGEALRGDMLALWQRCAPDIRLINEYGPTETVVGCCVYEVRKLISGNVPIGRPIANTSLYVLDRYQQPVPFGVVGELYIGGSGVARGYLNRPDLTNSRFIPDPFSANSSSRLYRTGDLVRYLADGNLEFLGRSDAQLKIRGYRIEPVEIESILTNHPQIRETLVTTVAGASGSVSLACYFVPNGEAPAHSELRSYLAGQLPEYMVPSSFTPIGAFPLTANGKIDKSALPSPVVDMAGVGFMAPRDSLEMQLTALWEEVLNTRPIGVKQNFFDLGGHSLLAVKLMTRIQQTFREDVPLSAILRAPTIEQLAAILRHNIRAVSRSSLVPMQPSGTNLPFFCVPGAGGNTIYLYNLSRQLGPNQPFYGLQGVGLDGEAAPHTTVEEMASHYLSAIQSLQPHGPYWLGGHSLGGWVAYEMAQQLERKGEEVAVLAILDTPAPIVVEDRDFGSWDTARWIAELTTKIGQLLNPDLHLSAEDLRGLEFTAQLLRFRDALTRTNLFPSDAGIEHLAAVLRLFQAHSHVQYAGKGRLRAGITLLRTAGDTESLPGPCRNPTWGWSSLGRVDLHIVPGEHLSMLSPPHVHVLGEKLSECLAQSRSKAAAAGTLEGSHLCQPLSS